MENRNRIFILIAIFSFIILGVTWATILVLYHASLSGQRDRLMDTAMNEARLLESVARFTAQSANSSSEIAREKALDYVRDIRFRELGNTGEITVSCKRGDQIEFLLNRRYQEEQPLQSIPYASHLAEPSRRALNGGTGTLVGLDYRGRKVLAAYTYVRSIDLGVVAKIDFTEIQRPFIHAVLISGATALLAILMGAALFFRITNPMVLRLAESERKYRHLIENLQEGIWTIDAESNTTFVNHKMAEMLGYTPDEMIGKHLFSFMDEGGVELAKENLDRRRQGIKEQHDFEFITKSGKRIITMLETGPLTDDRGRYSGALAGVIDITRRRLAEQALRGSEEKFRSIIEQSSDGILLTDDRGKVIEWNHGAERLMGLYRRDVLGSTLWDVQFRTTPETQRTQETHEQLKSMLSEFFETRKASWLNRIVETEIQRPDGKRRTIQLIVFPIQLEREFMAGSIIRDVTDTKETEAKLKSLVAEKDLLLREIYHRVKNNFQIIASLLNLQSQNITDPKALAVFRESHDRIRTMSLIHERLYRTDSLTGIDFGDYAHSLAVELYHSYGADPSKILLKVDARKVTLGLDSAIPCGLILNELVSNCLKYAFPAERREKGQIEIVLRQNAKGAVRLMVADDGKGLPEDLDIRRTKSLGLHLVILLAEQQLRGKLRLDRVKGTRFTIEFMPQALGDQA
jgi:PAS domain S-box-containing protein